MIRSTVLAVLAVLAAGQAGAQPAAPAAAQAPQVAAERQGGGASMLALGDYACTDEEGKPLPFAVFTVDAPGTYVADGGRFRGTFFAAGRESLRFMGGPFSELTSRDVKDNSFSLEGLKCRLVKAAGAAP